MKSIRCGDNLDVMEKIPATSVDLIYLDPPFFSGRDYEVIWEKAGGEPEVRRFKDTVKHFKIENDKDKKKMSTGKVMDTRAHDEIHATDIDIYLDWMSRRLREMHRILKPTGSIYLHCDWHASHYLKIEMDKIFGYNNFQNDISWRYGLGGSSDKRWQRKHDSILFYSKGETWTFNPNMVPAKSQMMKGELKKDDDVWEIPSINNMAKERLGYPTQKPEALLERIIKASSNPGDMVLDPFCGCGTTAAVANRLGRKFIGIDVSPMACKLIAQRLGLTHDDIDGLPTTIEELKAMTTPEFHQWVYNKMSAIDTNSGLAQISIAGRHDGSLLQIKQSEAVDEDIVKKLAAKLVERKIKYGFIVAFSFTRDAKFFKSEDGVLIKLVEIKDLIDEKYHHPVPATTS